MVLEDLMSEPEESEQNDISKMTPEDLAIVYTKAGQQSKSFYDDFVSEQPEEYREAFREAVINPINDSFDG